MMSLKVGELEALKESADRLIEWIERLHPITPSKLSALSHEEFEDLSNCLDAVQVTALKFMPPAGSA